MEQVYFLTIFPVCFLVKTIKMSSFQTFFTFQFLITVGTGFLTSLFYEDPTKLLLLFSNLSNPLTPTLFVVLFVWLTVWSHQKEWVILLNDIIFRLGTLVLTAPCCVFYATRNQIYWRFETDDMVLASTLIWHQTYRQTKIRHTGTNRLTHTDKVYIDINRYMHTPATSSLSE